MRLFVALEIPSTVRDNLAIVLSEFRTADQPSSKSRARWVRPENLHVTLKFIGHVDAGKLDAIREALDAVRSDSPFDVRFRSVGFFPNERRPRVLWVGMEASPSLAPLAKDIDSRLGPLGIPLETRDFTPHLTLARFDPPGISDKLRAAVQKSAEREFGGCRANEFRLMESKLRPSGAEYTTLQTFRFAAEG